LKETGIRVKKAATAPKNSVRVRGDLTDAELDTLDLVLRHGLRRAAAAEVRNCTTGNVDKQLRSARHKMGMQEATQIAFAAEVARLGVLPRVGPRELGARYNISHTPFARPAILPGARQVSGGPFTDYLDRLGRCTTQEQVAAHLFNSVLEYGVENYMLGAWAYQPDTGNPGPSFLSSYGEDWLKDLRAERYKSDPILQYADQVKTHASGPNALFKWSDVQVHSAEEHRFMMDADDAIGIEGVSASLPGPLGMIGAVSFCAHKGFDADAVKEKLFARAAAAHLKIIDINFKSIGEFDLTETELEILQELQIYSRSQIAQRRGVAVSTIKTHIDRIFEKLRVKREASAIMRGFSAGLITPPDWGKK